MKRSTTIDDDDDDDDRIESSYFLRWAGTASGVFYFIVYFVGLSVTLAD